MTNPTTAADHDRIVEVLHRYECDDDPPGHDWREHLPEDEPPYHPNRVDALADLMAEAAEPYRKALDELESALTLWFAAKDWPYNEGQQAVGVARLKARELLRREVGE